MQILSEALSHGSARANTSGRDAIRPALPTLLPAMAAAFLAACGSCMLVYGGILTDVRLAAAALAFAALLGFAAFFWQRRRRALRVAILSLAFLLAAGASSLSFYGNVAGSAQLLAEHGSGSAQFRVLSDPKAGSFSSYSTAELALPDGSRATVRLYWGARDVPAPLGSCFEAKYTFQSLRDRDAQLFYKGVCGTVRTTQRSEPEFPADPLGAVAQFRAERVKLLSGMPSDGAALMQGMLLGNTEGLSGTEVSQSFKATGLSHLIAVSGSHLAVIASVAGWLMRRLRVARPAAIVLLCATLVAYVLLTACQPSAIRAAVMALCAQASILAGKRVHSPSALVLAASLMLVLAPANAFSVGFWLSVFAVAGIVLFSGLFQSWIRAFLAVPASAPRILQKGSARLGELLALTFAAQLATTPIAVPLFSVVSLVSPLANLLVAPLASLLVALGIILLCLPMPLLEAASPLLAMLASLGDLAAAVSAFLASLPGAAVPATAELLPSVALALLAGASLYALWPRGALRGEEAGGILLRTVQLRAGLALAVALALALQLVLPLLAGPRLVAMDIGQGDALLVQDRGRAVLVDTGPGEGALLAALARQNITRLDAVVLTHLDADHCAALGALRGTVAVGAVYFASGLLSAKPDAKGVAAAKALAGADGVGELKAGDRIVLSERLSMEMLWPARAASEGGNAESVCLLLHFDADGDGTDEVSALLTGDAEAPELQQMLDAGSLGRIDILKVGHHGSKNAVRDEQLSRLEPQVALVSVGAYNSYGHPAPATLASLDSCGASVYRTDESGDVAVVFGGSGFKVRYATIEI